MKVEFRVFYYAFAVDVFLDELKWVYRFDLMLSGHEGIVFSLFEANVNRNMTSVNVYLTIQVSNSENCTLFMSIFHKSPILSRL